MDAQSLAYDLEIDGVEDVVRAFEEVAGIDPLPTGRAWRARARAMGHSRSLIRHVAAARRGKHPLSLVSWSDVALLDRAF